MHTITDNYLALNKQLHESNKHYGSRGHEKLDDVIALARSLNTEDILDYGCGKGMLANSLPFRIKQYDPAVEKHSAPPAPADIVVCTDVLEHIEPECIEAVMEHIRKLTKQLAYLSICTVEAFKTLPDGRNAHLLVRPPKWWMGLLYEHFDIINFRRDDKSLIVVAKAVRGGY
jgi:2-polyprenyl-3-methyl-5-hydroxy-6-metoxy-1,4-benzoquinol methylase